MRIIPPSEFKVMPWKNGGGITHEILKEERDGKLLWRLSIAEVASDGPFSLFPGLSRILTVIEGEGLELTAPDRVLYALPLHPVSFPGDLTITSKRIGGDVRDFNVIFDGNIIGADVTVHDRLKITPNNSATRFVLALESGTANGQRISAQSLVVPDNPTEVTGRCLQVIFRKHHSAPANSLSTLR
jgi:environmental stress-induced protein Ves